MLMPPVACDWKEGKRRPSTATHGVDFAEAIEALDDPLASVCVDSWAEYGEERCVATGWKPSRAFVVVYTEQDDVIRISSARKARAYERHAHEGGKG
jgi:uncharacterized DUF497 family protein